MIIVPAALTPFSRSVLLEALTAAHRRHAQNVGCQPWDRETDDPAILWDQRPVAGLASRSWGIEGERIAHLAGLPASSMTSPVERGPRNGAKAAGELAAELPARQERLRRWAQRVFGMSWSQAQLLQVMEEIEPYATDACQDEQQAAASALGSYAALCELTAGWRLEAGVHLDIVSGLETPASALVNDLVGGVEPEHLLARHGHRGGDEMELSAPRLAETGFSALQLSSAGGTHWQPGAAQTRRTQAEDELNSQAGLLRRGAVRKAVALAQDMLRAYGQAEDGLAWVLAAVRRWALAAGREGAKDGRLDVVEDIFWLELEEIKQMMTGEWHSREHVQPLITDRRQVWTVPPQTAVQPARPLGVAGGSLSAPYQRLDSPAEADQLTPGLILVTTQISPAWAPAISRAAGLMVGGGDFLCYAAAVGRAGGLPTVVAAQGILPAPVSGVLALDPALHRASLGA